ncbi:hypothetical protein NARC_70193 [Candidatus Nitrosocosmicus arcticus]|uniref:Uncharacterized protein n=1 Tax=Candidatus Nitrosocosmicus arcticus TaxID=2035267 RepID=A0A557SVJ8_9ARCH|nr:hypothetical protein NARC_70193 [Candidatus Nitrosocosmicus arcticus]
MIASQVLKFYNIIYIDITVSNTFYPVLIILILVLVLGNNGKVSPLWGLILITN